MRNRLLIAKEKLSRAFLAPPPPESPQSRVLETMRAASLRLMELGPSMSVDIDPQVNLHDTLRRAPPVVHAVGIGRKIRGSERRKEMAVRVYVTHKTEMHA